MAFNIEASPVYFYEHDVQENFRVIYKIRYIGSCLVSCVLNQPHFDHLGLQAIREDSCMTPPRKGLLASRISMIPLFSMAFRVSRKPDR